MMLLRALLSAVVGFALSILLTTSAAFGAAINIDKNGLALQGYDPVAYFTLGAPTRGQPDLISEHNGAVYRFSSTEHKALFDANPDKYMPAYGGYCAYGVAVGAKAPVEIDKFRIVKGKLYLNLNAGIQRRWENDITSYIVKANRNWPNLSR